MANNSLGRPGAQIFSSVIGDNVEIRHLDLSGNKFGDHEAELFSNALSVSHFQRTYEYFRYKCVRCGCR